MTDDTPSQAPLPPPENPYAPQSPYPQQPLLPTVSHPGRIISIVGLCLAFLGLAIVGIVLSIIGLVQSKRGGKVDVIAILGVVFNGIGVLVGLLIALAVYGSYQSLMLAQKDVTTRSGAYSIVSAAENYGISANGHYPRADRAGFIADIQSLGTEYSLQKDVEARISDTAPSASLPDAYKLSYCGGATADTATGLRVEYWSVQEKVIRSEDAGTGCGTSSNI